MRYARSRLVLLFLLAPLRVVAAQCDGQTVSAIAVASREPTFTRIPRPLRGVAHFVGLEHTTTKAFVLRQFLLLEVGKPCSAIQLAESERILRLQPFLAEARVRAVPDSVGGVRIEVETVDEIPSVFAVRFRGARPTALQVGDANVAGRAVYVAAKVEQGFHYRTGVGGQVVFYQAFGRPYTLALGADRAPLGTSLRLSFGHAFLTDLQRNAWHVSYNNENGYVSFVRPDTGFLSLGVGRRFADVGSVLRIGFGRHIGFLGGLLTYERFRPAAQAVVIWNEGIVADTTTLGPFPRYQTVRLNAVVGVRTLSFLAVRGFDALAAVEDVARGVQFGAIVGQGNDAFLSADLYAGLGSVRSFAALRVEAETRYDVSVNRWDAMVASGRVAWYWKPSDAHVIVASDEFSGGWRPRLPLQLTLGAWPGGVRGYQDSRDAGAVRNVARVEERWSLGRLTRHAGLGLAGFVDGGMVWAGAAPFGVNSGLKTGVGVGLLVALPPQSRRLWRLDVAVPVSPDAHARWLIRLTNVWVGGFWSEPGDVARARAGAAPSLIFAWP